MYCSDSRKFRLNNLCNHQMPFPRLDSSVMRVAVNSLKAYLKVNSLQLFYLSYVFMFVALLI